MVPFGCIAAMDERRGIGIGGKLPWQLRGDLRRFQDVTIGNLPEGKQNVVIMGRKTWESLPENRRPLPKRLNIVLTRDPAGVYPAGLLHAVSLDKALAQVAARPDTGSVFVIGGAVVFAEAVQHPSCAKLFLTDIEGTFEADTFFPEIPKAFQRTWRSERQEEHGIRYRFTVYERMR